MKPFCGQGCQNFCLLVSACGIIFLVIVGILFNVEVQEFTSSVHDPMDPKLVAQNCFIAAAIYAFTLILSLTNSYLYRKEQARQGDFAAR